jgi:hypothetical protein
VLHHVAPAARAEFMSELRRVVRRDGVVVVFEHNPWNPLTRVAVNRCEFDKDASLARRPTTRRLFERAGLRIEDSSYIIFTTSPRWSPRADAVLGWCPLGAQYYVAARRPGSESGDESLAP